MEDLENEQVNGENASAALVRLHERQAALMIKANQLTARAAHLQRVADAEYQRSQRRRDAHNKILLGALMMMVELHRFRLSANDEPLVVDTKIKQQLANEETLQFDKDLLIGALLTMSRQLTGDESATIAQRVAMRTEGAMFRKSSKLRRRRLLLCAEPA